MDKNNKIVNEIETLIMYHEIRLYGTLRLYQFFVTSVSKRERKDVTLGLLLLNYDGKIGSKTHFTQMKTHGKRLVNKKVKMKTY